ncbi:hypothetical protein [Leifsonia xyli]|uniref:hypothetical protein n=1 Tax=Leifsonia xyli TaxID=1575 RepID=UPI003D66EF57
MDQSTYLTAAAQLAEQLAGIEADDLFETALERSTITPPSALTDITAQFQSPLGSFRFNEGADDSRQRALLIAALLSRTSEQRSAVLEASYPFIGADQDYWLAITYQKLGDTVDGYLGLLSAQGWALRSIAAIRWVKNPTPSLLGSRFAVDRDVRVRRAFADAIAKTETGQHWEPKETLRSDPAFSVRAFLQQ